MQPKRHLFDSKTREKIDQLYLMHYWAQNLIHATQDEIRTDKRGLLWSSSFIQAYYTCETLSSIDWQASINKPSLEVWAPGSVEAQNTAEAMRAMLIFCFQLLGKDAAPILHGLLTNELKGLDDPVAILKDISSDIYYYNEQQNFRKRFERIIQYNDLSTEEYLDLVFRMVRFVYSVRDNIFRGYTLAVMMTQNVSLQLRLQIYSGLLLAVCELLFKALEQKSNWQPEITKFNRPQYEHYVEAIEESRLRNKGRSHILSHLYKR